MSVKLSSLLAARERRTGSFSVKAVDLRAVGDLGSPVLVLDDFRVQGSPFEPHPHAGFSAVTYVFEDSPGRLRSRDSLGHDVEIGPGGIVWTQAGRGVIHHEVPADFRHELHGLQLFVNLSARNKHLAPQMLSLGSHDVPVWQGDEGNRVRVVAGSYAGVTSPLVPPEPFDFLDVALRRRIAYDLPAGNCAIVYVAAGEVRIHAGDQERIVAAEQAIALHGGAGRVTFTAASPARFVVLSGAAIHEPVLTHGPFIMNDRSQIEAAVARYRAGDMGHLAPLAEAAVG